MTYRPKYSKPCIQALRDLYARHTAGETLKSIAESIGVSPGVFRDWLAQAGIHCKDSRKHWTKSHILKLFKTWYKKHQRPVTSLDILCDDKLPHKKTVFSYFSSLKELNVAIGAVEPHIVTRPCIECKTSVKDPNRFCADCRHKQRFSFSPEKEGMPIQWVRYRTPYDEDFATYEQSVDPVKERKAYSGMIQIRRH